MFKNDISKASHLLPLLRQNLYLKPSFQQVLNKFSRFHLVQSSCFNDHIFIEFGMNDHRKIKKKIKKITLKNKKYCNLVKIWKSILQTDEVWSLSGWSFLPNDMTWNAIWYETPNDMIHQMTWNAKWHETPNDIKRQMTWNAKWHETTNDMKRHLTWNAKWHETRNDMKRKMTWNA